MGYGTVKLTQALGTITFRHIKRSHEFTRPAANISNKGGL